MAISRISFSKIKFLKLYFSLIIATFVFIVLGIPVVKDAFFVANAQSTNVKLSGYAWSSTIGWLSFSETNSSVTVSNGNLTGYAWSPNIGWVRFGGNLGNPPSGSLNATISGNQLSGWARACSVFVSGCEGEVKNINGTELGGWDGWISLNGSNYSAKVRPEGESVNWQVPPNGNNDSFAWGAMNVGWLSFAGVFVSDNDELCSDGSEPPCGNGGGPSLTLSGGCLAGNPAQHTITVIVNKVEGMAISIERSISGQNNFVTINSTSSAQDDTYSYVNSVNPEVSYNYRVTLNDGERVLDGTGNVPSSLCPPVVITPTCTVSPESPRVGQWFTISNAGSVSYVSNILREIAPSGLTLEVDNQNMRFTGSLNQPTASISFTIDEGNSCDFTLRRGLIIDEI